MIEDSAFSHKMIQFFLEILNLEGHPNCINGSRVSAMLLTGWIFPVGGAFAASRVCDQLGYSVYFFYISATVGRYAL